MRANISMLRRKTWHICKNLNMLNAHLKIYKFFGNYFLKKNYKDRGWMTPAMHLGILKEPVGIEFLYNTI